MSRARRIVVTVCPREAGAVRVPVEDGERACRLDARGLLRRLRQAVERRGVADRVQLSEACAGGCRTAGPNVGVTIYPLAVAGERGDHVAIGWRTYVHSLPTLDCLARIIDENLDEPSAPASKPPAPSARRSHRPAC
jgi:hypothetical protein